MTTSVRTAQRESLNRHDPYATEPRVYAHTWPMRGVMPGDPLLIRHWEPMARYGMPNVATPPRSMGCPEYHDYLLLVDNLGRASDGGAA